eukprot:jgi/Bigna1/87562/estExt_fgenesh1_pg.C_210200
MASGIQWRSVLRAVQACRANIRSRILFPRSTSGPKLVSYRRRLGVMIAGFGVTTFGFLHGGGAVAEGGDDTKPKKLRPRILDADDRSDFFRPFASMFGKLYDKVYKQDKSMLLPPALPDDYGGIRRTLVLNLEGTLVHTIFKNEVYTTRVRPFVPTLLADAQTLGYEIVVFSNEPQMKVELILPVVDPKGLVLHRLFQENCSFLKGRYVKDLERLNRDLKNVILVDYQHESWFLQPENAFILKRYKGKKDTALVELDVLLELIQQNDVDDVRPILSRLNAGESINDIFNKDEAEEVWKRKGEAFKREIVATREKNGKLKADIAKKFMERTRSQTGTRSD